MLLETAAVMENEGGGGFMTRKFMGIPAWVFLVGAAAIAYYMFSRNKTPVSNSTSGGGGSVRTGNTKVQTGAVRINVSGGTGGDEDKDHDKQPKPPHKHHGHGKGGAGDEALTSITVHRAGTLEQIADNRGWGADFLKDVENLNNLKSGSKLKKGQHLRIPKGNVKATS